MKYWCNNQGVPEGRLEEEDLLAGFAPTKTTDENFNHRFQALVCAKQNFIHCH